MTREEELYETADNFSEDHKYEEDLDYVSLKMAFIEGAEWADNHPINVWHDVSEMPKENYKNIIYQTNYYSMYNVHIDFIPTCLRSCKITSRSWNEFVKEVNMRRWAYINDLLPKGGEK